MNSMERPIHVLIIEDTASDFLLIERQLRQQLPTARCQQVLDRAGLTAALQERDWDIILSDYNVPGMLWRENLAFIKAAQPEVPVILISGSVGEEQAIDLLKQGLTDFILKDKLARLPPAIERGLQEAAERRARHAAEDEVRESHRQLQYIIDNTHDVIFQIDLQGNYIFVNSAAERLSGYPQADLLHMNMLQLVAPEYHTMFKERLRERLAGDGVEKTFEFELLHKDGHRVWVELTTTVVLTQHGGLTALQGVARDITARKNLEAQLLRTQRLESVGRLASGLAHDLNNILTPMLMAPSLLRAALRDPAAVELVDTIETSALRGADIIKQLLTFGRGMEGQQIPLQLRTLIREMMKIIKETFPKNITARQIMPADLPLVMGDDTQLHQVLMNLCVNARDAMPTGGTLTLELATAEVDAAFAAQHPDARPGRYIVLSVSDTGTGIAPEIMDKIFDPFFTTKKIGEGTGLGLSTVLGITQGHHGFILVASVPDQGTQFKVYLPVHAPAGAETAPAAAGALSQGRGELVLVVDDEDSVRFILRQILQNNGYRVLEAQDGAAALALYGVHRQPVQLILTDLLMPGMDGYALIRALRQLPAPIKIIAMGGLPPPPEVLQELGLTAQQFISKPFDSAALLNALREALA
jgi:PAS domain S-box-containing protein